MKRINFIYKIILLSTITVFCSCKEKAKVAPNFIVILTDDLGIGDLQAYRKLYEEDKSVQSPAPTPNLDKLADQGVICTRAYATAWCAPSRQALLSGKFANRTSAYQQVWAGNLLRKEGYKTSFIGKSHGAMATQKTVDCIDNNAEFDEWYGFTTGMRTYYVAENEPGNIQLTQRKGLVKPKVTNDKEGYLTDIFTRETVDFINRNKENPFFVYLAYNAPHTPLDGKPDDLRKLYPNKYSTMTDEEIKATSGLVRPKGEQKQTAEEHFKAMVYAVDRGIGEIFQALKKNGLAENTIIYFISDNGSKEGTNYPLSGIKHDVLEGGIRVPYIVWSKELEKSSMSGKYYDGLVSVCDVLPTCLSLSGKISQDYETDGTDIMPYLLGTKEKLSNRIYHFESIQRYQFGTKSKDTFTVANKHDKTSVIRAFIHDMDKRIYYKPHKNIESRELFFHLQDAIGKDNPQGILSESYDIEMNRISNATNEQADKVLFLYEKFISENKDDLEDEWSGEYLKK
jgi:arylsulfatase A-like enzyme